MHVRAGRAAAVKLSFTSVDRAIPMATISIRVVLALRGPVSVAVCTTDRSTPRLLRSSLKNPVRPAKMGQLPQS